MTGQKPRQIAAQVLRLRRGGRDFVEALLERALATCALSPVDRNLCQELVYGAVRWQGTLDWLIARKTDGRAQKAALQDLLRLGLYQILWLDRIPAHAAVHETVEQAKQSGFGPQSGFINAVLRGYVRELDATKALLNELRHTQPAVGFSHPEWLVDRWHAEFGLEPTRQFLEWNNTPPGIFARVNTLKTDAAKLLPQWREEGVHYDFFARDWIGENEVFELKSHPPLSSLPSFQQGFFYVQDPSTLLATRLPTLRAGDAILDLCAAPGGKTTYLAQRLGNEGRIVAYDAAEGRLNLVRDNCVRLGVTCVDLVSTLPPASALFELVLVDAPCSNTGVLRRRVDLRWRLQPGEFERLQSKQLTLLRLAATHLRPGGLLVYSTCSVGRDENSQVVEEFLREQPHFKLERERSLLPFVDGVDGAYVALLRK